MLGLLLVAALGVGCSRADQRSPYPHESVMTVMLELKLFLERDPYRRAAGSDLEGRNIFKVSLARLDSLAQLTAPEYADVLAFARGECLERLGEHQAAAAAFSQAADLKTSLAEPARARAELAGRLAGLVDRAEFAPSAEGFLNDLEVLERRLAEWIDSGPPYPYESLARLERERAQEERARLLLANRFVLHEGPARAVAAARQLVETNGDSHRINQNRLLAGEVFETFARDWAASQRPEEAAFDADGRWGDLVAQAREAYRLVAQADGDPAKLEGQARLRALDAWALRIKSLAR